MRAEPPGFTAAHPSPPPPGCLRATARRGCPFPRGATTTARRWFSLPAALKGLIDRTFLPGVAFTLPTAPPPSGNFAAVRRAASTGLVPGLINIKKVGVVTTYGAPRHIALAAGDGGNALFGRALLPLFHQDCAIAWAGLYDMHNTTHEARAGFIARVRDEYQHAFLPEAKR